MLDPNLDVSAMFVDAKAQRSAMHTRHLNEQMVRVLRTIGYDVGFQARQGQYLFDRDGARYLDLLSGFGVFAIGRNHPALRDALKSVLDSDLPNLVQMDVSTLAGVLAERLLAHVPYLDKVFFANSGAEAVEAAIKFARAATGRPGIVYCEHAFHGLTYGALSLTASDFPRRLRAAAAGLHVDSVQRSRRAGAGAVVAQGRGLHRRADPGQGRQHARPTAICQARPSCAADTARCSSPTKSRPASAAPGDSSRSSTGTSSRTWCCWRRRCPAATCRSARC